MSALISTPDNFAVSSRYVGVAYSGGAHSAISIDPAYPITNLFDVDTTKVTRWNYTRNATAGVPIRINLAFSLASDLDVAGLALLNVRLDPAITDAGIWAYTTSHVGALDDGSSYARADLIPLSGTVDRFNLYALRTGTALRAELTLSLMAPPSTSGYVEIGGVWMSSGLILPNGVDSNWSVSYLDAGAKRRNSGGFVSASIVPRLKKLSAPITGADYALMMGTAGNTALPNLDSILNHAGNTLPVLFIARDNDLHSMQKLSLVGYFDNSEAIRHASANYLDSTINVTQMR